MNKLQFLVTTNELTDNEIKKINLFGKLYWFFYLVLAFTSFISAFYFLSLEQFFKIGLLSIILTVFSSIFELVFNDNKRELMISQFNNSKGRSSHFLLFLVIIFITLISSAVAWPVLFLNYLFLPFGYINIINKKLSNNTHFSLKLNGTEHYKLNNKFHRELEEFDGEFYFLPACIKRFLPCFKNNRIPSNDYFRSVFKSDLDNIWYLFGCKQQRPSFYLLNSENLSKFKENLDKKRIESINKIF